MSTPTNRPDRIPEPQPENARQAVAMTRDDHQWRRAVLDINSTDGIKRNIEALWAAVDRLAAFVDGDVPSQNANRPQNNEPNRKPERQADYNPSEPVKTVHPASPPLPA